MRMMRWMRRRQRMMTLPLTLGLSLSPHTTVLGVEEELEEEEAEEAQPSYEATSEFDRYEVGVGFGTLLIDAKNAFNELDRA
jgi:hypothetical protein